jgi:hypothetical protein
MTVELILVLPVLLMLLAAMVQFCLLLNTREQFLAASRAGARAAAQGRSDAEAEAAARRVLGSGRLEAAQVRIGRVAADPLHPEAGGDRVEVVVSAPSSAVVPNLLSWAGFSLGDRELAAATIMNRE